MIVASYPGTEVALMIAIVRRRRKGSAKKEW